MRRLFAKLSLAAILVLSALPHYAGAADSHAQRDSIERALPAMSAAERIAAYSELAEIAEPAEAIVWIDLMENLARQTGDEAGIIAAMYKRAMYYYVAGTLEDFLDASGAVAPLLLEAGDRRYVFTEILVIKRLIAEGRTETASRTARKFLEVAGESDSRYMEGYANYGIGLTCQAGGYLDESATAMEKGYAILLSEKDVAYKELVRVAFDLIDLLIEKHDYADAVRYGLETERMLEGRTDDGEMQLMKMYLHSDLAICHVCLGDHDKARRNLEKAAACLDPYGSLDNQQFNKASAMYYRSLGQYDKALEYAGECVRAYSATGGWISYYIDALELEAELLAETGDYASAYGRTGIIRHLKDSLASQQLAIQLSEFYTLYEVDRLEAQRQKHSIIIAMTSSLCLLLLVLISIFILYSRRLARKNRFLYNSIQEKLKKEKEQSGMRQFVPLGNISEERKLYYRLCGLMDEEQLFRDSNLKRSSLAQKLGTNEKYLTNAVTEGAGTTVSGFINEYRLNYSIPLLSDNGLSLEEIAEMSGFGAYSSFFRAFSRKFGMTPHEYRKQMRSGS